MTPLRDRPTADLIVFALTAVVVVTVTVGVVGVVVTEIWHPDADTDEIVGRIGRIISSILTLIIGYVAGRGVKNGNGASPREG